MSERSERTFIMIKPDGVQRGLIGEIISRFERQGYKLVAMKLMIPSRELLSKHYSDLCSKSFYGTLINYVSSGPVCAMVWEGEGVVRKGRMTIGETDPQKSLPGSIRGDFALNVEKNVIHGSDGVESAKKEISLWFSPSELLNWKSVAESWLY